MNEIEELKRQIRVLERRLSTANTNAEKLKIERREALDKYHDTNTLLNNMKVQMDYLEEQIKYNHCEHCSETQSQYDKIRSAFDRNKSERKAIIKYLDDYKINVFGKKLSASRMIREGKELLEQDSLFKNTNNHKVTL